MSLTRRKTTFYLIHFIFLIVQGFFTLLLLLRLPSEAKNALLWGFSFEKLLLLSVPLSVLVIATALLVFFHTPSQLFKFDHFLNQKLSSAAKKILVALCLFLLLAGIYILAVLYWRSFFVVAPPEEALVIPFHTYHLGLSFERNKLLLQQLLPIIYLVIGLCIQNLFFLARLRGNWDTWKKEIKSRRLDNIFLVYGFLLIFWLLLAWGSTRFEPDLGGYSWTTLGAPILDRDVLLTFIIGFGLIGIGAAGKTLGIGSRYFSTPHSSNRERNFDIAIVLVIWLVAAGFWLSLPTKPSHFVNEPVYPNFEYYPNSDALKYDATGHNMLLGADLLYLGNVMHKPLYSAFLALLHSIAGPEFERITLIQSAIFGVFPALVYLLIKRLHSRLAGIIAASLVILREVNSIVLASRITLSNSRILMTETLAVIGIILIILMIFIWMDEPKKRIIMTMFIGAGIGILSQIRNELIYLLPVILIFSIYIYFRFPNYWLKTSTLFVAGVILFMIPWQIRILHLTETPFLMIRRANSILSRFEKEPDVLYETLEEDLDSPLADQRGSLNYFITHLVHNQIQAFLIFPDAFRLPDALIGFAVYQNADRFWENCCSTENYVDRLFDFWRWKKWDGSVQKESFPAIFTTLFFLSVGLVKAREKSGARALFPLFVLFAFYLLLSGFRMSGGRRVQAVDWIWIIYFSVGLSQFALWIFRFLISVEVPAWLIGTQNTDEVDFLSRNEFIIPKNVTLNWRRIFSAGLLIFFLGALVPIIEQIIPSQYKEEMLQSRMDEVLVMDSGGIIGEFLENGGVVQQGKGLYPRFLTAGDGEEIDNPFEQAGILKLFLAGPTSVEVVLPFEDGQAFKLPHYSDVIVVGCNGPYFDALGVYIEAEKTLLIRDPLPERLVCPFPPIGVGPD